MKMHCRFKSIPFYFSYQLNKQLFKWLINWIPHRNVSGFVHGDLTLLFVAILFVLKVFAMRLKRLVTTALVDFDGIVNFEAVSSHTLQVSASVDAVNTFHHDLRVSFLVVLQVLSRQE